MVCSRLFYTYPAFHSSSYHILCSFDATKEDRTMGRLINHSKTQANVVPRQMVINGKLRLFFLAKRDINTNEEVVYDYGERRKHILDENPWLRY